MNKITAKDIDFVIGDPNSKGWIMLPTFEKARKELKASLHLEKKEILEKIYFATERPFLMSKQLQNIEYFQDKGIPFFECYLNSKEGLILKKLNEDKKYNITDKLLISSLNKKWTPQTKTDFGEFSAKHIKSILTIISCFKSPKSQEEQLSKILTKFKNKSLTDKRSLKKAMQSILAPQLVEKFFPHMNMIVKENNALTTSFNINLEDLAIEKDVSLTQCLSNITQFEMLLLDANLMIGVKLVNIKMVEEVTLFCFFESQEQKDKSKPVINSILLEMHQENFKQIASQMILDNSLPQKRIAKSSKI